MTARLRAAIDNQHSLGMRGIAVEIPKARAKSTKLPIVPLERTVLKSVMQLCRKHPKVARVWRQNSGSFQLGDTYGKSRWFTANTAKGMADIMGILKSGHVLAIECKRPGLKAEPHQQAFLDSINNAGGLAFVAHSVEEAEFNLRRA